jgi:hypothetical protein
MTRRDKRVMAIAGAIIAALLGGVGAWAASNPGSYGRSRDGCITVSMPSTTGGALMHQCGAGARVTCRGAFARQDKIALLTRPQCRLAGLARRSPPAAPAGLGRPQPGLAGAATSSAAASKQVRSPVWHAPPT